MAKRRANGEGNIRKRKDGRWEGRYTAGFDPDTGKRITRNVLGKTQTEVKQKLKEAIQTTENLDIKKYEQYTVGQWAQVWFEVYAKPNIRESTALYYKNYIDNHIVPSIGKIPLKKLTSLDIQKLYNKMRTSGRVKRFKNMKNKGLSNKTIRGVHMMLNSCLEQAVKERILPYNPTNGCRIPPKEKKEMKVIPQEKIGAYLIQAQQYGVLPIFYLELCSGLRRGELLALEWADLDEQNNTISVNKTVNRMNGKLVVSQPKTPTSIRKVTIPDQAVAILRQEHEQHPDNKYMFPSPKTGDMYDPSTVRRIHKKLLERAGIDTDVRFHDLRHTFTTVMLQNVVDPKTLSTMLGHYSAAFTLDVYSHVTDQMQEQAAETMGKFMAKVI